MLCTSQIYEENVFPSELKHWIKKISTKVTTIYCSPKINKEILRT